MLTLVRLSSRRFRVGKQTTAISARQPRRGTSLRFTLSAAAKLQIKITRSVAGLRQGRDCVVPSIRLSRVHSKPCTRTLTVARLIRTREPEGASSVPFSGRIGRRPLGPGSYKLALSASNRAGASKPVTLGFTIIAQ
jgi:hypothetical protein